jgi:hypothetical protein
MTNNTSNSVPPIGLTGQPGQGPHSSAMATQQASVARQAALIGVSSGGKRRKYRGGTGPTTIVPVINAPYNSGLVNGPDNQQVSGTTTLVSGRAQATGDPVVLVGGYKYISKKGKGKTNKLLPKTIGGKRRKSKRRQTKRRRTKRRA